MDIRVVKFRVGSQWRVGGLYSPSLSGRYGAVLLLHGFPGLEKNEDIATELCRRGVVAFIPYFGGCWGSAGEYRVSELLRDAHAAHRLLSRYHHVDSRRMGVLGMSLGGWVALRLAADRPMSAVVAMAPVTDAVMSEQTVAYVRKNGKTLNIRNPRAVLSDCIRAMRAVAPGNYMPKISPAPLLFVQGFKDDLVLPAVTRGLFALARRPKEFVALENESHEFQKNRHSVVRIICDWIQSRLTTSWELPSYFEQLVGR